MIVRILSEGQYRLAGAYLDELNNLDNQLVRLLAAGDEARLRRDVGAAPFRKTPDAVSTRCSILRKRQGTELVRHTGRLTHPYYKE